MSLASALPLFTLAAVPGDPPPVVTRGKAVRPFIDTRKALDLGICILLPAFGIFLHQNNIADKARQIAIALEVSQRRSYFHTDATLCFVRSTCIWRWR
jgi:hypothetical protein